MKRLILILLIASLSIAGRSQGLFTPVPSNLFAKDKDAGKASLGTFKFIPRLNVGVVGTSYGKNPVTKQMEVTPLSAMGFGLAVLRYKEVDGQPFNDIGVNIMYIQNTQTPGSGVGLFATYNTGPIGLLNLGAHYDWTIGRFYFDSGLSFHF